MADQPAVPPDIVMQVLHRSVASVGIVVVAVFAVADWILAHEATDWVMPQEVVGTLQQAVTSLVTLWLFTRAIKKYGMGASQAFNGATLTSVEKRVSTLEGKPPT